MKVIHLSYSDINGGAARATYRIHHALRKEGIDSRMWVNKLSSDDWTVEGPLNKIDKAFIELRPRIINNLLTKTLKTDNLIIHSPSVLSSKWVKRINSSDADIVHLHWIQGEMFSISDIAKIKKPIVWSPQDMWVFSGAEHYTNDYRWRDGYRSDNRPSYESGFDLNRWTWKRKKKYWQRPIQIIASSQWLATCVNESLLMSNWPVSVVPNTINTDYWKPLDKKFARNQLDLPVNSPLVLFGAIGGSKDPQLVIFGQHRPQSPPSLGFPVHYMGHLYDDLSLRALYSSVDAMLIPSRQDNLPNTGLEAHACATPVIAFNTGGLADIVEHKSTGYLAKTFDIKDFANGIIWTLEQRAIGQLGNQARQRAVLKFSEKNASAYIDIYKKVLNAK